MLPYLSKTPPWFAFLVHPRSLDDLHRQGGTAFLRRYSESEADFCRKVCSLPPMVLGEITFGFAPVRGELIGICRMPEQMLEPAGRQAVREGVALAVQRGARVVGLGALTAPATGGGLTLLPELPAGVTLTNGNAYTAAVVRHNVQEAAAALGLGSAARVAVVGCTGSVGVPASHLLAEAGFDLVLVGRNSARVRHLLGSLAARFTVPSDLGALSTADLVVLLTSDPSARLLPEHVRPGAVVLDCAQPANVAPELLDSFNKRGVRVVEGGIVHIPSYACTCDLGMADGADSFACLAETYLFAREGIREHSAGRPAPELAQRLERAAQRYGICPKPLALQPHPIDSLVTQRG